MRRPIAEFFHIEYPPDVVVGDDAGHEVEAALDPDSPQPTWIDLSDRERPIELAWEPTWYRVIERRNQA